MIGWVVALVFQFWMGLGAAIVKPPVPSPATSTAGCNLTDMAWFNDSVSTVQPDMWLLNSTTEAPVEEKSLYV